jgi:4-amino-4-deoxy-L-arabinose transferase-like glycosyltransferase
VALAPLLGFISGAVNPDALLFAVSAALFYLLAKGFRRGLTLRLAAAIGAATAVGLLTKLNFLGLVPGIALGVFAIALRAQPQSRRRARAALAVGLAFAASPLLLYIASKSLTNPASLSFLSKSAATATERSSILNEISYIWQLYFPRLPGMTNYFPGLSTTRQLWFDGLVGLYGWADTVFPGWVDGVALIPAGLLALLCLRSLIAGSAALGTRKLELLVYAAMASGVLLLVGVGSYSDGRNGPFWEPRYLLPMLPLLGALLALAARGAGRRWGPAAGALIVVLLLAHDVFSQLLLVSRYYS